MYSKLTIMYSKYKKLDKITSVVILYLNHMSRDMTQWRSQNAEKVAYIKGRLLDQTVIIYNCITFQNENFS